MSILFYDDSPVFGGHEVMSLLGVGAVLDTYQGKVTFLASSSNAKLCEQVKQLADRYPLLDLETTENQSCKLEALRNKLHRSRITGLADRFKQSGAKLIVAIQGNIEHSSLALHAAHKAGIPSTSYIPVPHSNAEMGAKFGAIRDLFCTSLFHLPGSFITITDEMADMLRKRGAKSPIHIVYNGVDIDRFKPGDSTNACVDLHLPLDRTRIGMIGRIEFRQKQQNLLVQAVASNPVLAKKCHLVFAGDGPDSAELESLIQHHQLSGIVMPWCDPAKLYQALHALVIPSRYEGLPLVMLESLASGTTVLGSDRDGMKDLLPSGMRFRPGSPQALASTLVEFVKNGSPPPDPALVDRVRSSMSLDSFRHSFSSTILGLLGSDSHLHSTVNPPHN
jgi:glycosyltransferase involved in cell wall biosynthesis